MEYGFVSAGQKPIYSKPFEKLIIEDIVAAYITGKGYVGVGKVTKLATPINEFIYKGQRLNGLPYLRETFFDNSENGNPNTEYAVGIDWIKVINKEDACWVKRDGLFASRSTQCKLDNQLNTVKFIEQCFNVKFI